MTEYLTSRKDRWTDWLPQRTQDTINQSPLINTLMRMYNTPPADLRLPAMRDGPGNTSIDRIAEGRSTLAKEYPLPWHPAAEEAVNTTGFLANFLGPGARLPTPPKPQPQGIRAYHGSPHDFDKFDISKIGTGEGAQAYGRGLYFAEAENVAKSYRNSVVPQSYAGTPEHTLALVASQLKKSHGHADRVIETLGRMGEHDAALMAKRLLDEGKPLPDMPPGRMYEVRINADPETFLDWDKPLSQQSEVVKKAVQNLPQADVLTRVGGVSKITPLMDREGDAFYNALAEALGTPFDPKLPRRAEVLDHGKAAQALRDAGIPGVRYKDAGSRGMDAGTYNYSVFDDKLIEILRKYGLLPPIAAGAAASQSQEPPL